MLAPGASLAPCARPGGSSSTGSIWAGGAATTLLGAAQAGPATPGPQPLSAPAAAAAKACSCKQGFSISHMDAGRTHRNRSRNTRRRARAVGGIGGAARRRRGSGNCLPAARRERPGLAESGRSSRAGDPRCPPPPFGASRSVCSQSSRQLQTDREAPKRESGEALTDKSQSSAGERNHLQRCTTRWLDVQRATSGRKFVRRRFLVCSSNLEHAFPGT